MLRKVFKALKTSTPEEQLMTTLDSYLQAFGNGGMEESLGSAGEHMNPLAHSVSVKIPISFEIALWEKMVRDHLLEIKQDDPEVFNGLMAALFDEVQDEAWNEDDVLRIDFGFYDGDRHPIDYFSGFDERPGFNALIDACERTGLDFKLYFEPHPTYADKAYLSVGLRSDDGRPLLTCIRNSRPAQDLE